MADLRYERTPSQIRRGYRLVRVRVADLDRGLAADAGHHVGAGGSGPSSIRGRYRQASEFLARARATGSRVQPPEGGVDRAGRPFLDDGRHRFAAIRDSGAETVEIAVPRGQAARFARLFGGGGGGSAGGRAASLNQPLAGQVEPDARSWREATAADRRAFYGRAGELAVAEKRAELARAIGANGRRMQARKHPRPDGADGPVMTPHDAASRTSRLLAARATANGVTLYWHAGLRTGQKTPWGSILAFHARGAGNLPVRDVRLSRRGIGAVRRAMAGWWTARLREQGRRAGEEAQPAAPPRPSVARRIQDALARRYSGLKDYFRDPKDGFR